MTMDAETGRQTITVIPDMHMHSTVSDGTDSPQQILENIIKSGINTFSLTDHDAFAGAKELLKDMPSYPQLHFTTGIECSTRDARGRYHILGYGFDPDSAVMHNLVEKAHDYRVYKVLARVDFLRKEYGFEFTLDEMDELMGNPNPGKPHIANLMIRKGYTTSIKSAIDDYIDNYHGRSPHLKPDEAISAILESGGIPVLAHPLFGDGGQHLTWEEMQERLSYLMEMGLQGLECFYSGHTPEQTEGLLEMAAENDLYVSAGSDYHGANKPIRLGQNGYFPDTEMPEGMKKLLNKLF